MATKWYYQSMGAQVGPIDSRELLGKVRAGEVTGSTLVRKDDSQWVEAAEVGGLFEEASKPVIRKLCPYCGGEIREAPPCTCPGCERYLVRVYQRSETNKVVIPPKRSSSPEEDRAPRDSKAPSQSPGSAAPPAGDDGQGLLRLLRGWVRRPR